MKDVQWNAVLLAILTALFFCLAVKTGTPWAQTMTLIAFTSMCTAMQIKMPAIPMMQVHREAIQPEKAASGEDNATHP